MRNDNISNNQFSLNAESICQKINDEATALIKTITATAEKESQNIIQEAFKKQKIEKEETEKQIATEIEILKTKIFSTLELEKRKTILCARDEFIQKALKKLGVLISDFSKTKGYNNFLKNAILEGLIVLETENLHILYSSADTNLFSQQFTDEIKKFLLEKQKKDISLTFEKGNFNESGLIIQSQNKQRLFDNRFSYRIKREYENIYNQLVKEFC